MKRLVLLPLFTLAVGCTADKAGDDSAPTDDSTDDSADDSGEPNTDDSAPPDDSDDPNDTNPYEEIARNMQWADHIEVEVRDGQLRFISNGVPDHDTDEAYAGLGGGGQVNTATIAEQDLRYVLDLNPEIAASSTETEGGPIGPAVSGAVFFNPYDATGQYANEVTVQSQYNFMDACAGHPSPNDGPYHYHGVPVCSSAAIDQPGEHSGAVGFLFDGFPIYGPWGENGEAPTDLDECMGHVGPVPETDQAVYHYHTAYDRPYISNCYKGTPQMSGGMGP